jgi:hypothetical protein
MLNAVARLAMPVAGLAGYLVPFPVMAEGRRVDDLTALRYFE